MAADAGEKADIGEDVRDVFEAMLPRHWIDRLCVPYGVIERQHKRQLECGFDWPYPPARVPGLSPHATRIGRMST